MWDGRPPGEPKGSPRVSWDKLSNPLVTLSGNGEGSLSSMMMCKEEAVITDAVAAVSLPGLVLVDRSVRTQLCVLSKCEVIKVDM